jgi:hypothetical protein
MNDREKFDYVERVVVELVRRVDALLETPEAGRLIERVHAVDGGDEDLHALLDQVGRLHDDIETPGGGRGTLYAEPDGRLGIITDVRITGMREISTRPGDFNGVVWNEEMDRAPRDGDD